MYIPADMKYVLFECCPAEFPKVTVKFTNSPEYFQMEAGCGPPDFNKIFKSYRNWWETRWDDWEYWNAIRSISAMVEVSSIDVEDVYRTFFEICKRAAIFDYAMKRRHEKRTRFAEIREASPKKRQSVIIYDNSSS